MLWSFQILGDDDYAAARMTERMASPPAPVQTPRSFSSSVSSPLSPRSPRSGSKLESALDAMLNSLTGDLASRMSPHLTARCHKAIEGKTSPLARSPLRVGESLEDPSEDGAANRCNSSADQGDGNEHGAGDDQAQAATGETPSLDGSAADPDGAGASSDEPPSPVSPSPGPAPTPAPTRAPTPASSSEWRRGGAASPHTPHSPHSAHSPHSPGSPTEEAAAWAVSACVDAAAAGAREAEARIVSLERRLAAAHASVAAAERAAVEAQGREESLARALAVERAAGVRAAEVAAAAVARLEAAAAAHEAEIGLLTDELVTAR